jgi:hypothetical protein
MYNLLMLKREKKLVYSQQNPGTLRVTNVMSTRVQADPAFHLTRVCTH